MIRKKLAICLGLLISLFVSVNAQIPNGDFESGTTGLCDCPTGYNCYNDAGRVVDGIHPVYSGCGDQGCMGSINSASPLGAHSGTGYVYYYAGADYIETDGNISIGQCQQIELCVWYAGPQGNGCAAQNTADAHFSFMIDGVQEGPDVLVPDGTPWTQFCTTVSVASGNHTFRISSGGAAQYSIWFDDFSIVVTDLAPDIDLGNDTSLCDGETLVLDPEISGTYLWQDGSTNQTYTVTEAGTYWVEVTDQSGCVITDTIVVSYTSCGCTTPPVDFEITPPLCCGDNTVITYTGPGNGSDYTTDLVNPAWTWDIGSGGTLVSGNLSGSGTVPDDIEVLYPCNTSNTISLTVHNNVNGEECVQSDTTITFSVPEELTCTVTGTDPSCSGICDATAIATAAGGTGAYSYNWDNGAGANSDATGLCGGTTYSLTITDGNGCITTGSFTPEDPSEIVIDPPVVTDISCYGGNNGSVDLTVTGGTPGYSYIWYPGGQTTQDISNLYAGQYDVTVSDANQCTAESTIILNEPPELTSTISASDLLCNGDELGSIDVEVDGGTPPYTYFWQPTSETTEDIDNLPVGEYTVLITDANGCTTTKSIVIDEPYPILTQMTGTDILCFGLTVRQE